MIINGRTYIEEDRSWRNKAKRAIDLLLYLFPKDDNLMQYINRAGGGSITEIREYLSETSSAPGTLAELKKEIADLEKENKTLRCKLRDRVKHCNHNGLNATDRASMTRVAEILMELCNVEEST